MTDLEQEPDLVTQTKDAFSAAKRERYVEAALKKALSSGARTIQQLFAYVTFRMVVDALEQERSKLDAILIEAGAHRQVAPKMSGEFASSQLEIAVSEEVISLEKILEMTGFDTLSKRIEHCVLGKFLADVDGSPSDDEKERALAAGLVTFALDEGLVGPRDIIMGYGMRAFRQHLPQEARDDVMEAAINNGLEKEPFRPAQFLEVVGLNVILKSMPTSTTWLKMIMPKIFEPHGFTALPADGNLADEPMVVAPPSIAPPGDDSAQGSGGGEGDHAPKA